MALSLGGSGKYNSKQNRTSSAGPAVKHTWSLSKSVLRVYYTTGSRTGITMTLSTINSLKDIYGVFLMKSEKEIIEMLQEEKLLKPLKRCPKCRTMCKLYKHKDFKGTELKILKCLPEFFF